MAGLYQVFSITGPVFLIILIGYLAVKHAVVPQGSSQALSAFAVNFALPALLFKAISAKPIVEIFNGNYLIGYGTGSLLAFFLLFIISRKLRSSTLSHSAIFAMGGSFSNNLMIGYPVIIQLFGSVAMVPLALTLMIENFVMFPLTLMLADAGEQKADNKVKALLLSFGQVLCKPIIIGIIAGVLCSYFGVVAPQPLMKVIDLFAATVSGIALFAIGGLLVGIKIKAVLKDILLILPVKLIVHPVMILIVFSLMPGIEPLMVASAVILASMPMFGIYPIIAEKYGLGSTCAAVLVPTTIASFISLSLVIWLVDRYLPLDTLATLN